MKVPSHGKTSKWQEMLEALFKTAGVFYQVYKLKVKPRVFMPNNP